MDANLVDQAQAFFSQNLTPYLYNIVTALLIFFIGKWVIKHIVRWLEALMEKRMDHIVARFMSNILHVLLFVVVVIAALTQLGIKTTALVAVIGAISLAVGLSLKDSLSNFAAGVILIALRPFRIGDYIETPAVQGFVKDIKVFATTLTTADNRIIFVPNNSVVRGHIVNHYAMPTRRINMVIRVGYDTDLSQIKQDLLAVMAADARVLADPAPSVSVAGLTETGVDLNVRPWVESNDYWGVRWDVTEQIKNHFSAIKMHFPAQRMDLFMESAPATKSANDAG